MIYTTTWAFVEPWVFADRQTTPVTFHLTASTTSATIPTAAPISIIYDGSRRGRFYIHTSTSPIVTPSMPSTALATTSGQTETSPASTEAYPSSSAMHSNATLVSRTTDFEIPSSPIIAPTQPSDNIAHTASPLSKDKSGLTLGHTIGIAIGCIFAEAAFAVLAACVFVRRKRRSVVSSPLSERSGSKSSMSDKLIHRKSPPIIMGNIERPQPYMRFETLLARLSSGDELVAIFTQLNSSIAEYAQMCTSPNTRSQLLATETNTTRVLDEILGPESSIGVKRLAILLQHDQT